MNIIQYDVRRKHDVVEFFPRFVLRNNLSGVPSAYLHPILQRVGKHTNGGKRGIVGYVDIDKVFYRGSGSVHSGFVIKRTAISLRILRHNI